jgi:hypothetical protein
MSGKPVKRDTFDEMTRRIVEHGKNNGREIKVGDAQKIAGDSCERVDRKRREK